MKTFKILLLFVVTFQLFSCADGPKTDRFYTKGDGMDYICVPFIKPYRAMLLNGSKEWGMNFNYDLGVSSAVNIKKVNVINGAILLYCTNTYFNNSKNVPEAWFELIPSKHIEKGFGNHGDYVKFLKEEGIPVEPQLFDMNYISEYFNHHAPIDWAALNKSHSK